MSDQSSTLEEKPQAKIIPISSARRARHLISDDEEYAYQARILGMDKLALLEEMVRFQQERSERGALSLQMMNRGKYLFKALEEKAETQELRLLARSYRRHLEFEMTEWNRRRNGLPAGSD
ncbi:MAG: hypothetical protein KGQ59_04990 [Bdellovibrionales bacterium]|nr:hypothetical protein [Bdellovibrionales bacterium]